MSNSGLLLNMYTQQSNPQSTLGVPTSGFGSRGKNTHLRNIAVPSSTLGNAAPAVSTPRGSRKELLANLRTAPKTPTTAQSNVHLNGAVDSDKYSNLPRSSTFAPKTARGLGFGANGNSNLSPQLPTPPASSPMFNYGVQDLTNQLYNMNMVELALQQQRLQQQLLAAQQAQQQLAQLEALQSPAGNYATPPMSPYTGNGNLNQQYYTVYNPSTNQYYLVPQQQGQMYNAAYQQSNLGYQQEQNAHPAEQQMQQQQQQSQTASSSRGSSRSRSPPSKLSPVQETAGQPAGQQQASLPARRAHRKTSSLSNCLNITQLDIEAPPKTSVPKISGLPSTPMTATFAPGYASGTHPTRQPRGPPPFEEIKDKPTSKIEGSKNFATRQRKRAVSKLVSAGIERRGNRSTSGFGPGSMTPVSENEASAFEDGFSVGSGLSGRQSMVSLKSGVNSPKEYSGSENGDEGLGGRYVEVKRSTSGLKTPHLVLDAAEKRKSAMF